jgi:hypothetical protein
MSFTGDVLATEIQIDGVSKEARRTLNLLRGPAATDDQANERLTVDFGKMTGPFGHDTGEATVQGNPLIRQGRQEIRSDTAAARYVRVDTVPISSITDTTDEDDVTVVTITDLLPVGCVVAEGLAKLHVMARGYSSGNVNWYQIYRAWKWTSGGGFTWISNGTVRSEMEDDVAWNLGLISTGDAIQAALFGDAVEEVEWTIWGELWIVGRKP